MPMLTPEEEEELAQLEELERREKAQNQNSDLTERVAGEANKALDSLGQQIFEYSRPVASTIGAASHFVDKYTGAPIRAGVSAGIKGENPLSAGFRQFGQDPEKAPSGKDIAAQLGLSTNPSINTGLYTTPTETMKLSPAGIAGAGIETATDPLTYAGLAAGGAKKIAGKFLEPALRTMAEEQTMRALGAPLAQNRAIMKMAPQKGGDVSNAMRNFRAAGRTILDEPGVLKPWDNAESLSAKMAGKAEVYGSQMGEMGKKLDEAFPKSISGQRIAAKIREFANAIPETPDTKRLIEGINEHADYFDTKYKSISFDEAQRLRNTYQWKNVAKDAKVDNQDAVNMINGVIGDEMEDTFGFANSLDPNIPKGEDFKDVKRKYGTFVAGKHAGSDRYARDQTNRTFSPSDYWMGGVAGLGAGEKGRNASEMVGAGFAGAILNKQLRERGNALLAKTFESAANAFYKDPKKLGKYERVWRNINAGITKAGGAAGIPSAIMYHRILMNNDPEYHQMVLGLENNEDSSASDE